MSNKPKVSVVVPIYGVEKYLKQCVDSILAQTLTDIEVILVDDGSPDKCPEIIDEYAKKDNRVVAVHQPNGGYGTAVNHGISVARGEYIGIVESDDWIEPEMYETLYNDAKNHDVDMVKGMYFECFDTENGVKKQIVEPHRGINPLYNPFNILDYPNPLLCHASIWTAIYRTDFIRKNNIRVLEINKGRYADQNWRFETLLLADKIYWERIPFYNYRLTNENASSFKKNNPDDIFDIYIELEKFLQKHPEKYDAIKDFYYHEIYHHMIWNIGRVDKKYYFYCLKRIKNQFKYLDKNVIKNIKTLSRHDRKNFLTMLSYKTYFVGFMKRLFSIQKINNAKILTIFNIDIILKHYNTDC